MYYCINDKKVEETLLSTQMKTYINKCFLYRRFHSITTQYYRKADGILVMYDVTQTTSLMAVRDWLNQVQVRPICDAKEPF